MENNESKNSIPKDDSEVGKTSEIVEEGSAKEIDHQKAALEAAQKAEKEILYMRAEFENYKKRLVKDQESAIKMANKNLVSELVSVVDLFEHAIAHSSKLKDKGDQEVVNFVTGIEMTRAELSQVLNRFGVELVGQVGEEFDPNKHEAISEIESKEQKPNTVLSVVQKGCMLHGKLLKPARVVVVKAS